MRSFTATTLVALGFVFLTGRAPAEELPVCGGLRLETTPVAKGRRDVTVLGGQGTRIRSKPIATLEELRGLLDERAPSDKGHFRTDLIGILGRSGRTPEQVSQVLAAFAGPGAQKCLVPRGALLEWMAYRNAAKQPELLLAIRWWGQEPFVAFEAETHFEQGIDRFLIPSTCGNLAFVESEPPPPCLRISADWACSEAGDKADVTLRVLNPGVAPGPVVATVPGGPTWSLAPANAWTSRQTVEPGRSLDFSITNVSGEAQSFCGLELTPRCPLKLATSAAACSVEAVAVETESGWTLTARSTVAGRMRVLWNGQPTDELKDGDVPANGSLEGRVTRPGDYSFEISGSDGSPNQTRAACAAKVSVAKRPSSGLAWRFSLFFGKERRTVRPGNKNCAPLVGGAVGLPISLGGDLELVPTAGVAFNTRVADNSSAYFDAVLAKRLERGELGLALGAWDLNHSKTLAPTLAAVGGWRVREGGAGRAAIHLTGEVRLFLDELDDISNHYQFWFGVRFQGN